MTFIDYIVSDFPFGRRLKIEGYHYTFTVLWSKVGDTARNVHIYVQAVDSRFKLHYYPNNAQARPITFLPYEPEDFPKGTIVSAGIFGENAEVIGVRSSRSEPEKFRIELRSGYTVPNNPASSFRFIRSRPEGAKVKAEVKPTIHPEDRVRVTPKIEGLSGSVVGTVYHVGDKKVFLYVEPSRKPTYFPVDSEDFVIEVIAPTWEEKLAALPLRTILEGTGHYRNKFAVKMSDTHWAVSDWTRMTETLAEGYWILPND